VLAIVAAGFFPLHAAISLGREKAVFACGDDPGTIRQLSGMEQVSGAHCRQRLYR